MTNHYDLIVLGGGNAGQAAAGAAVKAGQRVVLIEARDLGGTCPNRGCVPKKVLVAAAESLDTIARAQSLNIHVSDVKLDWPALIARKDELIAGTPAGMEKSLLERGVDVIHGRARFVGPRSVSVDGRELSGKKVLIATGSRPRPLPMITGHDLLATSEDVLSLPTLPSHVTFVGGGVIAFELGHVLIRAGAKVSILEVADRALANFDPDAADRLLALTQELGIDVQTGVRVQTLATSEQGFTIHYQQNGETHELQTQLAVNAAGRVPWVDDLGLDAAGVERDGYHVPRDAHLRSTTNPDVFLAGDVLTGTPQLSPIATLEGRVVGHNLTQKELIEPDYSVIPRALFTVPTLAAVGMGEAEAQASGREFEVKTSDMTGWLGAKTYAERAAYAKVIIDRETDEILGAHLLGHGAGETVHLFAMAIRHHVKAEQLRTQIYAYPTFSNDVKFTI